MCTDALWRAAAPVLSSGRRRSRCSSTVCSHQVSAKDTDEVNTAQRFRAGINGASLRNPVRVDPRGLGCDSWRICGALEAASLNVRSGSN
jgi:hypothetical protein